METRLWRLSPYGRNHQQTFHYHVLTPEPIEGNKIVAAWAYALRHTAKGLDLPDHDAALALMLERHPTWQIIEGQLGSVPVQLALASQDETE